MQRRRSDDGRWCGNASSGLENESQEVGSQRRSLPKELHESWVQEIAENGYGASESVRSACSGDGPQRKIYIEEANGGSSREEGDDLAVLASWKHLA